MKLENIQNEIKSALKIHNTLKVETLRSVVAAVKKAAIDRRIDITDELVDEILLKELKTIGEMIDTCPVERAELLSTYTRKEQMIKEFAPKIITDEAEIKTMILDLLSAAAVEPVGKNKSKVMKTVMPAIKGKVDMAIANKVIKEILA